MRSSAESNIQWFPIRPNGKPYEDSFDTTPKEESLERNEEFSHHDLEDREMGLTLARAAKRLYILILVRLKSAQIRDGGCLGLLRLVGQLGSEVLDRQEPLPYIPSGCLTTFAMHDRREVLDT